MILGVGTKFRTTIYPGIDKGNSEPRKAVKLVVPNTREILCSLRYESIIDNEIYQLLVYDADRPKKDKALGDRSDGEGIISDREV